MKKIISECLLVLVASALFTACGSSSKKNENAAGLEKYPQCYHINPKLTKKCIEKNDAGQPTTALDLENAAYPGQYQ